MKVELKTHLREVLDKRGLSQKELSKMTGIREATISTLARGNVDRISVDIVSRICSSLEIDDVTEIITLEKIED